MREAGSAVGGRMAVAIAALAFGFAFAPSCTNRPPRVRGPEPGAGAGAQSAIVGSREASRNIRASDNRPHGWEESEQPVRPDRTLVRRHMAETQVVESTTRKRGAVKPRLSASECLQVMEARPCPLLDGGWRARDIAGGVALTGAGTPQRARWLKDSLQCFVAYRAGDVNDPSCLQALGPLRSGVKHDGRAITVRLIAAPGANVERLRDEARKLIAGL